MYLVPKNSWKLKKQSDYNDDSWETSKSQTQCSFDSINPAIAEGSSIHWRYFFDTAILMRFNKKLFLLRE